MTEQMKAFLVVVAHPDDEVLGFGGTAAVLSSLGHEVGACILSGDAEARTRRPDDGALYANTLAASKSLGMLEPILGPFPNIKMNTVPHLDLVQFIEEAICERTATHIVTHHPGDLNDDHRQVANATQAAARIYQRRDNRSRLLSLSTMEVPSSTDWSFATNAEAFVPTAFYEIGREGLSRKLEALQCYRDVCRAYPHPRSEEVIEAWAVQRGAQAGLNLAEAFQVLHLNLTDLL